MKKKIVGIFVCMLVISTALSAVGTLNNSLQVKNPEENPLNGGWEKTFGGSDYDFGTYVMQTNDGGYIIAAETKSYGAGGIDFWLIKTDSDGNEEWNKTYGGSEDEWPYFILQTTDGYIITGLTRSFGAGDYDVWLIKTDANGNKIWDETYGGTGYDFAWTLSNTTDNGYVIGGATNSYGAGDFDYWMIKTDANGVEQWNKTFGTSNSELFRGMRQTDDGGYILVGFVISASPNDVYCWLVRTDADGNKLWDKKIEGKRLSGGFGIRQTNDGGFIISGETVALGFTLGPIFMYISGDMWLVKTDANGTKVWDKSFGRIILESCGRCIGLTDEGGYIVGGFTKGFGSSIKQTLALPIYSKTWVVETDADGNKVREKEFSRGICWWIEQTNDGGYILTGGTEVHGKGDIFLIKID